MLVFSSWPQTLDALLPRVARLLGSGTVAQFTAALGPAQLVEEADRFQARDDCRLLFSDELGGEGRNFQIADRILHLDLPWTPAQLEQRIGRVDRFGRAGRVLSVVPFARDRFEHDLFRLWQEAFHLFTQSMSGLEIALEGVQDEVRAALRRSLRHGLADLLPATIARTARLREEVEKERLFEESAIKKPRRQEFQSVSERYRDGELIRGPFLRWANLAGLRNSYSVETRLALFRPREFSLKSMYNAKFFNPPNMEDALVRSGRLRDHVICGTFHRDIAVRREDYVFFAPGTDPWTDALVANAIEADRGRCCAILRAAPELDHHWFGAEFRFSISIDPRPLLAGGHSPTHMYGDC